MTEANALELPNQPRAFALEAPTAGQNCTDGPDKTRAPVEPSHAHPSATRCLQERHHVCLVWCVSHRFVCASAVTRRALVQACKQCEFYYRELTLGSTCACCCVCHRVPLTHTPHSNNKKTCNVAAVLSTIGDCPSHSRCLSLLHMHISAWMCTAAFYIERRTGRERAQQSAQQQQPLAPPLRAAYNQQIIAMMTYGSRISLCARCAYFAFDTASHGFD